MSWREPFCLTEYLPGRSEILVFKNQLRIRSVHFDPLLLGVCFIGTHFVKIQGAMSNFLLCYGLVFNPGGDPYDGLYGEALPKRGTFFRLQVYERVGILLVEVYERPVEKSVIWVSEMAQRAEQMNFIAL